VTHKPFTNQDDLRLAIDAYANAPPEQREQAWATLTDFIAAHTAKFIRHEIEKGVLAKGPNFIRLTANANHRH
jgi:hypothetical protein